MSDYKAKVVSDTGRLQSEQTVSGSDVSLRIAAGRDEHARVVRKIQSEIAGMSQGLVDPTILRRRLERYYFKQLQDRAIGNGSQVRGAKTLSIAYARTPAEVYELRWRWLPASDGSAAMVIGLCPECLMRAPSQVDVDQKTRPTFVEGRLGWMAGNPEADAKEVTFRLTHPLFHMWIDENAHLTVRELVKCPSGRHGAEARLIGERCGWVARITDGVAIRTGTAIIRPGKRPAGPTNIVVASK